MKVDKIVYTPMLKMMRHSIPISRRAVVGAVPALLAACAVRPRLGMVMPNVPLPSDSVQLSCYAPDGASGFTVRLGRYPTLGISWVWAHVFLPDRIWSYTDDRLKGATRSPEPGAVYLQQEGAVLRFAREGAPERPSGVSLSGRWRAHPGGGPRRGSGAVPVDLRAQFLPESVAGGILVGRSETKGRVEATLNVAGGIFQLAGDGHFHEQAQDTPRFTTPFAYLRGGGAGFAFTFIKAARAAGNFSGPGGGSVEDFEIEAPGPFRRFAATLAGRRRLVGEMRSTHEFLVPIFGGVRRSQIVAGTIDGKPFVGGANDWMSDRIAYSRLAQGV